MCNVIATCYTRIVAQVSISYAYLGFYQVFRGKRSCSRLAFFSLFYVAYLFFLSVFAFCIQIMCFLEHLFELMDILDTYI